MFGRLITKNAVSAHACKTSTQHSQETSDETINFPRMTDNLQVRIDAALSSVRNNRLGLNILEAGMVRDLATTLDGKVRFSIMLSAADDATIVRDARQAVEQVAGVSEVRVDVRDAAQPAGTS